MIIVLCGTVAGGSVLVAAGIVFYKTLRPKYPAKVNCWFCHHDTVIPYGNRNCWDCPNCEQYNGFTSDGDYNKEIPAQRCSELNHPVTAKITPPSTRLDTSYTNILCDVCNRNQQLKIRQLANFVPCSETSYDVEVEAYRYHLEQVYRLCRVCETNVERELARQDATIRTKLHHAGLIQTAWSSLVNSSIISQDSTSGTEGRRSGCANFLQLSSLLCAFLLFIVSLDLALGNLTTGRHSLWLPGIVGVSLRYLSADISAVITCGTFSQILVVYASGKDRLSFIDALSCFSWLLNMLPFLAFTQLHDMHGTTLCSIHLALTVANLALSLAGTAAKRRRKTNPVRFQKLRYRPEGEDVSFSDASMSPSVGEVECHSTPDVPYVAKLEMMSIGTPAKPSRRTNVFSIMDGDMYSQVTTPQQSNLNNNSNRSNEIFKKRSLLALAKFTPPDRLDDLILPPLDDTDQPRAACHPDTSTANTSHPDTSTASTSHPDTSTARAHFIGTPGVADHRKRPSIANRTSEGIESSTVNGRKTDDRGTTSRRAERWKASDTDCGRERSADVSSSSETASRWRNSLLLKSIMGLSVVVNVVGLLYVVILPNLSFRSLSNSSEIVLSS